MLFYCSVLPQARATCEGHLANKTSAQRAKSRSANLAWTTEQKLFGVYAPQSGHKKASTEASQWDELVSVLRASTQASPAHKYICPWRKLLANWAD
jgi:hypothetical protein